MGSACCSAARFDFAMISFDEADTHRVGGRDRPNNPTIVFRLFPSTQAFCETRCDYPLMVISGNTRITFRAMPDFSIVSITGLIGL